METWPSHCAKKGGGAGRTSQARLKTLEDSEGTPGESAREPRGGMTQYCLGWLKTLVPLPQGRLEITLSKAQRMEGDGQWQFMESLKREEHCCFFWTQGCTDEFLNTTGRRGRLSGQTL